MSQALFLAAALNLTIECNSVVNMPMTKENVTFEHWSTVACQELSKDYQNVEISVLRKMQRGSRRELRHDEKGTLSIDNIRAGRGKISWRSKRDNTTVTFASKITGQQDAWVFQKQLNPETLIRKRHVKKVLTEVTRVEGIQERITQSPVGMVTKKRTQKGQLVTENLIAQKPLVKRNDLIDVVLSNNGLRIQAKARALNNGWNTGEKIQVKIKNAEAPITALVRGEKLAHVEN